MGRCVRAMFIPLSPCISIYNHNHQLERVRGVISSLARLERHVGTYTSAYTRPRSRGQDHLELSLRVLYVARCLGITLPVEKWRPPLFCRRLLFTPGQTCPIFHQKSRISLLNVLLTSRGATISGGPSGSAHAAFPEEGADARGEENLLLGAKIAA